MLLCRYVYYSSIFDRFWFVLSISNLFLILLGLILCYTAKVFSNKTENGSLENLKFVGIGKYYPSTFVRFWFVTSIYSTSDPNCFAFLI